MRKSLRILALTGVLTIACSFTAMANWEQTGAQWKYKDDATGTYLANGWNWLDGNGDGVSECYYLNTDGIMTVNTMVDGWSVNEQGQWTVAGVVQTKVVSGGSSQSNIGNPSDNRVPDNPYIDKSNPYAYDGDLSMPEETTIDVITDATGYQAGSSEGLPAMH